MGLDNTALPDFVNEALSNWYASSSASETGTIRVSDAIMGYGGNKNALARDLAGIPQEGKLPASRNVNRWLKAESGKEGQKRKPNPEKQEKLKQLVKNKTRPKDANFVIMGTIAYSSDVRDRVIGANGQQINLSGSNLDAFLDNIAQGNIQDAYQQLFEAYGVTGMVMQDDSEIDIDINFS
jgi:hypothetical protein